MLLTEPVSEDLIAVPSPESMKNKVIVRAKKPQGQHVLQFVEESSRWRDILMLKNSRLVVYF